MWGMFFTALLFLVAAALVGAFVAWRLAGGHLSDAPHADDEEQLPFAPSRVSRRAATSPIAHGSAAAQASDAGRAEAAGDVATTTDERARYAELEARARVQADELDRLRATERELAALREREAQWDHTAREHVAEIARLRALTETLEQRARTQADADQANTTHALAHTDKDVAHLRARVSDLEQVLTETDAELSRLRAAESELARLRAQLASTEPSQAIVAQQASSLPIPTEHPFARASRVEMRIREPELPFAFDSPDEPPALTEHQHELMPPKPPLQPLPPFGAERPLEVDDLKAIRGIGPKLESMLNELGIYTFRQIASWTDTEVREVDARLKAFHGRIQRDDWITSARDAHLNKYGLRL